MVNLIDLDTSKNIKQSTNRFFRNLLQIREELENDFRRIVLTRIMQ
jgi:hypothetical protein